MYDQEFVDQVKAKIERLTQQVISLQLDEEDRSRLSVDPVGPIPHVIVGANVLRYPGFARMAIEYAVASIRRGQEVDPMEFQLLLSRN